VHGNYVSPPCMTVLTGTYNLTMNLVLPGR
jgi:hypothetical protein